MDGGAGAEEAPSDVEVLTDTENYTASTQSPAPPSTVAPPSTTALATSSNVADAQAKMAPATPPSHPSTASTSALKRSRHTPSDDESSPRQRYKRQNRIRTPYVVAATEPDNAFAMHLQDLKVMQSPEEGSKRLDPNHLITFFKCLFSAP